MILSKISASSGGRPHADMPPRVDGVPPAGQGRATVGPLSVLYLGFPLWWALGLTIPAYMLASVVMLSRLLKRRPVLLPPGFGVWVLFLLWVAAGVAVLWAHAPGTVPGGGPGRLIGYGIRSGWYAAATIAMLYVYNARKELSDQRVARILGWMFVITALFGIAAVIYPSFEFRSLMELALPASVGSTRFIQTLIHPALSSSSDFLGYVQPRPTAPFPYSNAWGNNLAIYLPFFVVTWFTSRARWQRALAPLILAATAVPIAYSLNRGLWLALLLAALYAALRLALTGRLRALSFLTVGLVAAAVVLAFSPLYDTVALRIETPHSNDRRANLVTDVISVTSQGSPFVGYGTTRTKQGAYSSLAAADTASCPRCAPPPLGTQGFLWRLILTTGFVGTIMFLTFIGMHLFRRPREADSLQIACETALLVSIFCYLVYDSLGPAFFATMIVMGLMSRRSGKPNEVEYETPT